MQTVTAHWLHSIDELADVPEAQLQWMIDNSTILSVKEGEVLFRPGMPAVGAYILISGRMHIYDLVNQEMRDVTTLEPKAISGYLPFSRGVVSKVYVEATADSRILLLAKEKFREMISQHFELTQALVHVMTNRVRSFTSLQQQNEKMMALGKLSAGLTLQPGQSRECFLA